MSIRIIEGYSHLYKNNKFLKYLGKDPDLIKLAKEEFARGNYEIAQALIDEIKKQKTRLQLSPTPENCELISSDLSEVALPRLGKADLIITDPPYGKEYLPLYDLLGEKATVLVKDGGSILVMTGQSYLPEVIDSLKKHLTYHWSVAYLTPGGQSAQLWSRKVNTFWKPVLWFTLGKYEGQWIGDVSKSAVNDNDKRFHEWGQSESGMADLVKRFSKVGDIILDPFMGGGTTGKVALQLGRKFIGIDISADIINTARARITEVVNATSTN